MRMRSAARFVFAVTLALAACASLAGDLEAGLKSYKDKNYSAAAPLLTRAAAQGSAQAQALLAWMYLHGEGVAQDPARASIWLRKAAAQGNAGAQHNLGQLYANGTGVNRDLKEALTWFNKAAAQGDARAQYNAGLIYAHGLGVDRDFVEAYKWLALAAAHGFEDAIPAKAYVETRMSQRQVAEARSRASEWAREHGQTR
jgi:TPR repeat protein